MVETTMPFGVTPLDADCDDYLSGKLEGERPPGSGGGGGFWTVCRDLPRSRRDKKAICHSTGPTTSICSRRTGVVRERRGRPTCVSTCRPRCLCKRHTRITTREHSFPGQNRTSSSTWRRAHGVYGPETRRECRDEVYITEEEDH
jgi:hypothetical protein